MNRLLIVSNRLSITVEKRGNKYKYRKSVGGVATGLGSFYQKMNSLWIGWCGLHSDYLHATTKKKIVENFMSRFQSYPVFLSHVDIRLFYSGFCNRTIWPVFHYFPQHAVYDNTFWESYQRVNRLFAQEVLKILQPEDIVWIHDYHLMLLPGLLRKEMPGTRIGFFLHIPFPSYEIFRLIPWRSKIVEGLLGSDLVGFHTFDYCRHFLSSVRHISGYEHSFGTVEMGGRLVKVDSFPMGIDYENFANADIHKRWIDRSSICPSEGEYRIILSIDRLDYTKGIVDRLKAFDLFLDRYPEFRKKVMLMMIAVPSRTQVEEYRRLKQQVDELVGNINGRYGTIEWTPIHYINRNMSFEMVVSLYDMADVALITPLRDGMNLIAKEYVVSRKDGRGVLILSEMAGASSELAEAILVNPNDHGAVAEAMVQAINMPVEEQIRRNTVMKERLRRYNVVTWAEDFIGSLNRIFPQQNVLASKQISAPIQKQIATEFRMGKRRLIFLDVDGTLIPFRDKPEKAKPDREIERILLVLVRDKRNAVVLISGRDRRTLDDWFGGLSLGLTAEHGVWMKPWKNEWELTEHLKNEWKDSVRPILERYMDKTPGAFIEEKTYSLVWHYRNVIDELAYIRRSELKEDLLYFTQNLQIQILEGSKVIEVKNSEINKGKAGLSWMNRYPSDFIMAIGDDCTDEDLFAALPETACTIKVGSGNSKAKYVIPGPFQVREFLRSLTSFDRNMD